MKKLLMISAICVSSGCFVTTCDVSSVWADEPEAQAKTAEAAHGPLVLEFDEEKMSIEADIPMVDLILSFRELQDREHDEESSFLNAVIESARCDPF